MSTDVTPSVMAVHTYSARCGAALVETLYFYCGSVCVSASLKYIA